MFGGHLAQRRYHDGHEIALEHKNTKLFAGIIMGNNDYFNTHRLSVLVNEKKYCFDY